MWNRVCEGVLVWEMRLCKHTWPWRHCQRPVDADARLVILQLYGHNDMENISRGLEDMHKSYPHFWGVDFWASSSVWRLEARATRADCARGLHQLAKVTVKRVTRCHVLVEQSDGRRDWPQGCRADHMWGSLLIPKLLTGHKLSGCNWEREGDRLGGLKLV